MLDLVDDLYQQGLKLHGSGKVELAYQVYTLVLNAHPEHSMANHSLGVLSVDIGKVQEALPFFEAALEANADVAQFWVSYIDALINLERIADAQAVFGQAKSNGAKGEGFDKLERRLTDARGEPLTANSTGLEEKQPKHSNILDGLKLDQALSLARKKARGGDTGEAKRIYQDILAKFPKNKRARDGLKGLSSGPVGKESKVQDPPHEQLQALINLYSQGQLKQALDQANILLQKFPSSSVLYNICGAVYKDLGQFDASIEAFSRALTIQPDYADAYNNKGLVLQEQGKLEEAIEAYNKALAIKPDHAGAYNNMGNALKDQGKLEDAIEAYNKALAIKPDYAEAYYNMGNALKDQGKIEEAIEAYNKALAIKPDNVSAIHQLGKLYKQLGQASKSKRHFEKALSLGPVDTLGANLELALLGEKEIPSKTPQAYMKEFYKRKANHWGKESKYNGHVLIEDAFNSLRMEQNFANILDLGCGTGSLAPILRPYSKNLDGVDVSPDMIKHAKETGLYDAVYQQDIETYLGEKPNQYDVVIAAAVLIHFFDLQSVLSLIRNSLSENGKLIFSVFEGASSDKELNEFLMYSHSAKYINDLADLLGFQIQYKKTAIHEYHDGKPISALVYILQK
jgi:predicted TPR repeat methyltransferase